MISIIILVHNNIAMTRQCLELLAKAVARIDHELILLDNGSSEDTTPLNECRNLFQHLRLLRSEANLSFSNGNNFGAGFACGNYLLFLNNDVFLDSDAVECMLDCMRGDPSVGIVGGMLLFPGRESVQHAGMHQMLWGFASNFGVGARPEDERVRMELSPFAVTGAMQCARKSAFQKVGGFDQRYLWGYEDVDLCLRIRKAGSCIIYEPQAKAVHVESATLKIVQNRDTSLNYRVYREIWDPILIPREQRYIHALKAQGVKRIAVVGTGLAASGLSRILNENGIRIVAFTSTKKVEKGEMFLGRPVLPLDFLNEVSYDRLMVASQFYFAFESLIREFDPLRAPLFPILIE